MEEGRLFFGIKQEEKGPIKEDWME